MGLSGQVPSRVDAVTKHALLTLVDDAVHSGWTCRDACRYVEVSQRRVERWKRRVHAHGLDDRVPGGNPVHGLTPAEADEIVAVFDEWADIDRSHRKLAHRGSWLGRFWAAPSTVKRVLERHHLRFRAPKHEGRSTRRPWPDWVEEAPNRIWIYDTTHWTRAGAATTVISDVITRKWIAHITSADETSIEVQAVFNRALKLEGIDEIIDEVNPNSVQFDPDNANGDLPVLLVMSDNGPQMTSGSTREFMALCWLATHYGRPGTPTDQAWIESLFGHLKNDTLTWNKFKTSMCCEPSSTSARGTTTRSASTPASATSPPTSNTTATATPSDNNDATASPEPDRTASSTIETTNHESPIMRADISRPKRH